MENKNFKFCLTGLNQFYYLNNDTLDYENLIDEIIANFEISDSVFLREKINENIDALKKHLKEKNLIKYLPKQLLTDNGFESLVIYNSDPLYLLIDRLILENDVQENEIRELVNFEYYSEEELIGLIKDSPKSFIIFNHSIPNLVNFRRLGCWTVLIANISFSYFDLDPNSNISEIINANIEWVRTHGNTYDLSAYNFYQLVKYYKVIRDINDKADSLVANTEELAKYFEMKKPIKCLLFLQCLKRYESFKKKQKFFISNERVLYVPHIGQSDLSINGDIDIVLAKAVESRDYTLYKSYFDKFEEYCKTKNIFKANDFKYFPYFVQKDLMHEFMENFLKSDVVQELIVKYKKKISLPFSIIVDGKELMDKQNFLKLMLEHKFTFPILVKYQSNSSFFFKHLATMIFDEKSLDNYLTFYNSLDINNLNCILQSFVNHGGHVIKIYRINQENHIDWRSSLPDINPEFDKNFTEGFWTFKTTNLESETYKELWRKYHGENLVKDVVDYDYIYSINKAFEKFSGMTLYGLDLLYGSENNEFYLIDVNAFPGYKIKGIDIGEKMREHIETYFKKIN